MGQIVSDVTEILDYKDNKKQAKNIEPYKKNNGRL